MHQVYNSRKLNVGGSPWIQHVESGLFTIQQRRPLGLALSLNL